MDAVGLFGRYCIHDVDQEDSHGAAQIVDEQARADPKKRVAGQHHHLPRVQQLVIIGDAQKDHKKTSHDLRIRVQLPKPLEEGQIDQGKKQEEEAQRPDQPPDLGMLNQLVEKIG